MRLAQVLERGDDHRQAESADEDVEDAGHVAKRQRALHRPALRHATQTLYKLTHTYFGWFYGRYMGPHVPAAVSPASSFDD